MNDISAFNTLKLISNNKRYSNYEDKFICGKTDEKSDVFNVLLFIYHDIEEAIIPSFNKVIGSSSNSFDYYEIIQKS